jgi:hypothetical protein
MLAMEYIALKKKEDLPFAIVWMNFKDSMVSEVN